jgi:hypothetical protein
MTKIKFDARIPRSDRNIVADIIRENRDEFYNTAFCNIMGEFSDSYDTDLNILISQVDEDTIVVRHLEETTYMLGRYDAPNT